METLGRRRFLQAASWGTAAGLFAPATWAAGSAARGDSWKMRLSTSSIHYMQLPVEEACGRIAQLGFDAVDIWSAHAGCPHLDDVAKRLGPDGLKEVLDRNDLKLFSFSVYRGGYPRYAELLGRAGGGVAVRGSAAPCPPNELPKRMRAFLDGLKPELELAEKHDSWLAIENHGHALLDSLDSIKAFTDLNRSSRLGIALAPYHLQAIGVPVDQAITECGSQLLFFYAWQRGPGVQQLPGHGPTDFVPWVKALAAVGYTGYVNPFMHGELEADTMSRALATSRDYLRQCDAKARKE